MRNACIGLASVLALSLIAMGCKDTGDSAPPQPVELTRDATGYFCQMVVVDHPGPKAQIHLADRAKPIFFPSVVDAIAFLRMPGESKAIRVVYVNDMGRAHNWKSPEPGTWIDASAAYYVIGSKRQGGMGHDEAIPFGTGEEAEKFRSENGGQVLRLDEIPTNYVLRDVDAAETDPARIQDQEARR